MDTTLPRLCARGYRGPIYATPATIDLLGVMLPDSAHIQEKDAEWAREHAERETRHRGNRHPQGAGGRGDAGGDTEPLYTIAQAEACLRQFVPGAHGDIGQAHAGARLRFNDAAHILGSGDR